MKKLLIPVFLVLLSVSVNAQYRGLLAVAGFSAGRTDIDHFTWTNSPTGPNGRIETTVGGPASARMSFPTIGIEAYGKHAMMVYSNGFGLKHRVDEYNDIRFKDREIINFRLAAGFYIKKTVGLMGGFQFQYALAEYENFTGDPKAVNNTGGPVGTFYAPASGGGTFGYNLNGLISLFQEKFLIRASYLSGNISRGHKLYKGHAKQMELVAIYSFNEDKTFGVFAKVTKVQRHMDPTVIEEVQFSYSGSTTNLPEFTTTSRWVTIGVHLPGGIFGGAEANTHARPRMNMGL